ncbi:ComEC/Rec2 family competence protein [Azospirillum oryzae]|uniref:ComEC/Rec2 family competence protein n=1 Tax=Azospirillum oryzae TaxID=286727 RepID=A0A6N1ASU2_9PROT|nr:ComEC/Rec2 family competence protein [Azospirillum oryzae]KAA0591027.1 ComEC family competence protein [Azospirillum oryzae]QKS52314.1 ComEC/Rec2 family competence protein [Azospirillum oryzae]GLR78119.1 competence protein ComEC [Azospirillum oryzae]
MTAAGWPEETADGPPALGGRWRRLLARAGGRLAALAGAEGERWVLWLPVAFGAGVSLYFGLRQEPVWWGGLAGVGGAVVLLLAVRRWFALAGVAMALLMVAAGFLVAQAHTVRMAAPVLTRSIAGATVTGRVMAVERRPGAVRITLREATVSRLAPEQTPAALRIRLSDRNPAPVPGSVVRLRATLLPPQAPAEPGAFDFQRRAWFMGLGGTGFATGAVEQVEAPPVTGWSTVAIAFERARGAIAERVAAAIGDPVEASVTTALLNGEEFGIPEATLDDFRNSGLAHLLSISGLHVGIAAGILFYVVRALLAAVPYIALRWPIKKIAALFGIVSALAYTLLVGAPLPTVRSVLMTGMVMGAIMLDRHPLSMRLVAFAGLVTIAMDPEGMLGPSFQMSFAAVVALIAAFERGSVRLAEWRRDAGWFGRGLFYVGGILLTSVVATLATLPFSLFHFQQIAFYGVLSNLIAIPITSFWVMPWSLIAYALLPFGLEAPALIAMNWGDRAVIWTAAFFGRLPWASLTVPAMPVAGFAALVAGGLWLCVWRRRWRWLGMLPILAGLASPMLVERPDVLVAGDGTVVAVRLPDGRLSASGKGGGRVTETWRERDGERTTADPWPVAGGWSEGERSLSCDALGCLYRLRGKMLALPRLPDSLDEDCGAADAVVTAAVARGCRAGVVVDRWALRHEGAHTLTVTAEGIKVETVRGLRGDRPWTGGR